MLLRTVAILWLAAAGAEAQLIGAEVTQWLWQASVVVDNYLYISGGEYYILADGIPQVNYLYETVVVDISASWTNATMTGTFAANPGEMDTARQPILYYDGVNNLIKRFGGWPYTSDALTMGAEMFELTPDGPDVDWVLSPPPTSLGLPDGAVAPWQPASASSDTAYYSLGGGEFPTGSTTDQSVQGGLIIQDFVAGTFSNNTARIPNDSDYRVFSRAVYAPNFGESGYLVVVGGENPDTPDYIYEQGLSMVDMSEITLYDIASGTWYKQTATGDIPPPRSQFCMVGTNSSDGLKFDAFIYGGSVRSAEDVNAADDEGYLNVYSLSLPAFRWFKSRSTTPVRRSAHTCSIIGQRQMISIGGRQPSSQSGLGGDPDPWISGIGVFDMTEFAWTDSYNALADPYEQPDVIAAYYSSDYTEPEWSDEALAPIFRFASQNPADSEPTPSDGSTPSDSSTPSSGASSPSTTSSQSPDSGRSTAAGPIAGGIVGGIVGLGALAGIVLILIRRAKQRRGSRAELTGDPKDDENIQGALQQEVDGPRKTHFEMPVMEAKPVKGKTVIAELHSDESWRPVARSRE